MKTFKLDNWLPTTKKEVEARGWDYLDVILFSGDAYVDHPSFGVAVIGRCLEGKGYRDRSCIGSGRITGSDRTATGLAGRLPGFQEARRSPAFLRCIRRCHGFNDQPLYCQ